MRIEFTPGASASSASLFERGLVDELRCVSGLGLDRAVKPPVRSNPASYDQARPYPGTCLVGTSRDQCQRCVIARLEFL
jgi:hypothetical protein